MPPTNTGENPYLKRAYALDGPDSARALYDEWAATYDADTGETMGYVGHEVAATRLAELAPAAVPVLDAGCGTGLVAAALAQRGFTTVDGLDVSPGMLERARATGHYRDLRAADLTAPLEAADDAYAAVICCGTLTEGHVGPEALVELVRVTRPGGLVVATVLDDIWERRGYRAAVDALVADGRAVLREAELRPYRQLQDVACRLLVLEAARASGRA